MAVEQQRRAVICVAAESQGHPAFQRQNRRAHPAPIRSATRKASARRGCVNPVNPHRVVWDLSPRLLDKVIVTSDLWSGANWYARPQNVGWIPKS